MFTGTTAILCTLLLGTAEKRPIAEAAYSKTPRYVSIRVHFRSAQEDASTMVIVHCRSGQIPLLAVLGVVRPGSGTAPDGNAQGGCGNDLAQTSFVHENMHLGHLWCTNGRQKGHNGPISRSFVHQKQPTTPLACTNRVCATKKRATRTPGQTIGQRPDCTITALGTREYYSSTAAVYTRMLARW